MDGRVRAVKGDQTGYAYTEDLTPEALVRAAKTAAAIADGPAMPGPKGLALGAALPARYPVQTRWEDVRPQQKLPLLSGINERAFAAEWMRSLWVGRRRCETIRC